MPAIDGKAEVFNLQRNIIPTTGAELLQVHSRKHACDRQGQHAENRERKTDATHPHKVVDAADHTALMLHKSITLTSAASIEQSEPSKTPAARP